MIRKPPDNWEPPFEVILSMTHKQYVSTVYRHQSCYLCKYDPPRWDITAKGRGTTIIHRMLNRDEAEFLCELLTNNITQSGHWRRRTLWQWLTRKPKTWEGGLFRYMLASGYRPVYANTPDEPATHGLHVAWYFDEAFNG